MSWDVQFNNGVWLPQIGWSLDARLPVDRSFVSHAHFDHLAEHREVLCSPGTARLMRARMPAERIEHILPFGQVEQLSADCSVALFPAGHIFGSAQSLLHHAEHGTLLYTGDFKLRHGLSAEACETPAADVVIMETTFGKPQYVFPPTEEVLDDILRFCRGAINDGETPVLFGYSLGKSQEILTSLARANLPVMLHPATFRITKVYEELGIRFPAYREFEAGTVPGHVVLCPPQSANSSFLKRIPSRRTAILTGWAIDSSAVYRYQCDTAFPLSDHADFPDLLRFVDAVKPKVVYTLHGFAKEFARTLRERGVEAWAVGEGNQLDLAITAPSPIRTSPPVPPAPSGTGPANAHSFEAFALTANAVGATTSKKEKTAALAAYLQSIPPADAALAAVYLTGRAFANAEDRRLNLGWAAVKRAVLDVAGCTESDLRAAYRRFADAGDAAAEVLTGRTQPRSIHLGEIAAFFNSAAQARGSVGKVALITEFLGQCGPQEAKYLIKIITGDLRIGLKEGLLEEAVAVAANRPLAAIREANMLSGDIGLVTRRAFEGGLDQIELSVFHPLQFMLASPEPTAADILARLTPPVWLEEKYDGIRCQIHKQGTRVELYSRDLHRITDQFPDLARAALDLPGDFIGDGELLAWRDGRALPFAELQKRLGRKGDDFFLGEEIPVSLSLYDLLWRDGRVLIREPLRVRRERLADLLATPSAGFVLAPIQQAASTVEIEAAFLASRHRGNEGLMAKDPESAYTPGRRGLTWLKLKKAYATLDVVVVAVELGHGKRRNVLSDYTFAVRDPDHDRLLTVGKAYSGLTDVEIAELTRHFIENTLEENGRKRIVAPNVILEVAFDSIQRSDRHESGFALRFPRINRIRTDKTVAQIDTLETCRRLSGNHAFADAAARH